MSEQCCWTCLKASGELATHMIVCPECGSKRCPKAEDHRNGCQGPEQGPRRATEEDRLRAEVEQLQGWKDSANAVLDGIDLQAVGKELAVPLAGAIGPAILPGIRALRATIEDLEKRLAEAEERTWIQCTTKSNECLGGCRSMKEHDRYREEEFARIHHDWNGAHQLLDDAGILVNAPDGSNVGYHLLTRMEAALSTIAAMTEELRVLREEHGKEMLLRIDRGMKLTSQAAHIERLREALRKIMNLGGRMGWYVDATNIAKRALAALEEKP